MCFSIYPFKTQDTPKQVSHNININDIKFMVKTCNSGIETFQCGYLYYLQKWMVQSEGLIVKCPVVGGYTSPSKLKKW